MNTAKELEIHEKTTLMDVIEALRKVEFSVTGPITIKLEINQGAAISREEVKAQIEALASACNVPLQVVTSAVVETQKKELPPKLMQLEKWIAEGKWTKAQLIDKYVRKFAGQRSSIITMLSMCKNKKYNKFEKLVVEDEKGIFKFVE